MNNKVKLFKIRQPKNGKVIYFDIIFLLVNFILMILFFNDNLLINLTFSLNFLLVFIFLNFNMRQKEKDFFTTTFIIFSYLFFFLAPVIQTSIYKYPNTLKYNPELCITANLYISLFIVVYFITIFMYSKTSINKVNCLKTNFDIPKQVFLILFVLCLIIFFIFFDYIFNLIINNSNNLNVNSSLALLMNKFLFCIPVFLVGYLITNKQRFSKKQYTTLLLISSLLLIWFINPFTVKRNSIGVVYLTMFFTIFRNKFQNNFRVSMMLIVVLVILFPLSSIITYTQYGLDYFITNFSFDGYVKRVLNNFTSLHYDAWSNFMATIEYTKYNGITYGVQLIGAIGFFIPRVIWKFKPLSSGQLIGNYLMNNYHLNINNLSNPIPSEGYLNFGIFGVIIFAVALAVIGVWVRILLSENGYKYFVGIYVSSYAIFFIRGDMMNGIAYLTGALSAIYFLPIIVTKLYNHMIIQKR